MAFLAIADLTAASLDEIQALEYWLSNVPMRLTFLFFVTAYAYTFKDGGIFAGTAFSGGVGELVQNSMVFTWGFMELAVWFWVRRAHIVPREEVRFEHGADTGRLSRVFEKNASESLRKSSTCARLKKIPCEAHGK